MIEKTQSILACIVAAGLLGGSFSCGAGEEGPGSKPKIITISLDAVQREMVLTGSTVRLRVDPELWNRSTPWKLPRTVQWYKDLQPISRARDDVLVLPNVGLSDAATYRAVLAGDVEEQTAEFHLSVYYLFETNSNGGTMAVPVGDFIKGTMKVCGGSFDRYKVYFPFYGPDCWPQSGPFTNTCNGSNLTVTTCHSENAGIDTAIQIKENWLPMREVCCSNDYACVGTKTLSSCTVTGLQSGKTYRVGIFFKSSTLGGKTTVLFTWLYF